MLINRIDVVCIQVVAQDIYDDTGINFFRYTSSQDVTNSSDFFLEVLCTVLRPPNGLTNTWEPIHIANGPNRIFPLSLSFFVSSIIIFYVLNLNNSIHTQ